jgi:hypothetical protein
MLKRVAKGNDLENEQGLFLPSNFMPGWLRKGWLLEALP